MKNFILLFCAVLFIGISSCSNNQNNNSQSDTTANSNSSTDNLFQDKDSAIYFNATGTEPFWGLEISDKRIVLNLIEDSLITQTPRVTTDMERNIKTYRVATKEAALIIAIAQKECTNGMSGKVSPYSVEIEYKRTGDEKQTTINGCGNYLN